MSYKVFYSEKAAEDLRDIYRYIAFSLSAPKAAERQTNDIMEEIIKLDENPLRYPQYRHGRWKDRGMRFFAIHNYTVFYIVDDERKQVSVVRIMYGRRNIEKQLNNQ